MASSELRREVLKSFKSIHRTCSKVFQGDERALTCARSEINNNYKQHKDEKLEEKIRERLKFAYEVIHELKSNVLQLEEVRPGRFEARIRPEMFEEVPKPKKEQRKQQES